MGPKKDKNKVDKSLNSPPRDEMMCSFEDMKAYFDEKFKLSEENYSARANMCEKLLEGLQAQLAPLSQQLQRLEDTQKKAIDAHAQIEKRVKVIEKQLEQSNSGATAELVRANEQIRELSARSEVINHKCFFEYAKMEGMEVPGDKDDAPEVAFLKVLTACIPQLRGCITHARHHEFEVIGANGKKFRAEKITMFHPSKDAAEYCRQQIAYWRSKAQKLFSELIDENNVKLVIVNSCSMGKADRQDKRVLESALMVLKKEKRINSFSPRLFFSPVTRRFSWTAQVRRGRTTCPDLAELFPSIWSAPNRLSTLEVVAFAEMMKSKFPVLPAIPGGVGEKRKEKSPSGSTPEQAQKKANDGLSPLPPPVQNLSAPLSQQAGALGQSADDSTVQAGPAD